MAALSPGAALPVPLWRQLDAAASVVRSVRAGRTSSVVLEALELGVRPGGQAIAFAVLRDLGRAEALRSQLVRRAPPAAADALLCCALALLWRAGDERYDDHTLVDQTVEAAKRQPRTQRQAGFINACLRRFLRERQALVAATAQQPVARWNHPLWWIDKVRAQYPQHWQRILQADNAHAPLTLRVNVRRSSVAGYLQRLHELGIGARQVGAVAVSLDRPLPVPQIPGFPDGVVSVQDEAAQRAAPLLLEGLLPRAARRPLRVLDACAAPGGKTAHLLEAADCEVVALDVDPARCDRVRQNLQRLSLRATVLAADAAQPQTWWPGAGGGGEPFDAILLDAPCTASGIVRRHPDVRWLRRDSDVAQLASIQATLLAALWPLVRPGGRLLYCTCSVFREEGEAQIETFLAHHIDAASCASPGHLLPGSAAGDAPVPDNGNGGHDGFFYALLEKRKSAVA